MSAERRRLFVSHALSSLAARRPPRRSQITDQPQQRAVSGIGPLDVVGSVLVLLLQLLECPLAILVGALRLEPHLRRQSMQHAHLCTPMVERETLSSTRAAHSMSRAWWSICPTRLSVSESAVVFGALGRPYVCLLYTSPSPRDRQKSRMPSSA